MAVLLIAGVACLTVGMFVAIRLWPSQKPESQESPNIENGVDALFPGRGVPEREKGERLEIAKETDEEAVRSLLNEGHGLNWSMWWGNPAGLFEAIPKEPRVSKILESLARDSSESNKERLLEYITEMCGVYLDLPFPEAPGRAPWKPTVTSVDGCTAYAYLLPEVDDDAVSLPLLVQMNQCYQSAMLQYMERFEGHQNDGEWGSSTFTMTLAYACDQFLSQYSSREDLRQDLTAEQTAILERFEKLQEERQDADAFFSLEGRIMEGAEPTREEMAKLERLEDQIKKEVVESGAFYYLTLEEKDLEILRIATEFVEAGARN